MAIKLNDLKRRGPVPKVAIRSMDLSLYQAEAVFGEERQLIAAAITEDRKPALRKLRSGKIKGRSFRARRIT
jgi:hypothetical protein